MITAHLSRGLINYVFENIPHPPSLSSYLAMSNYLVVPQLICLVCC